MTEPLFKPLFGSREFRDACGQFPTGVTAVTAVSKGGHLAALTVNSFASVSLDPPQVLFCLATSSSSFHILEAAKRISVHILREDQEDLARRFATSGLAGETKLEGVEWSAGSDGVPIIENTSATLVGRPGQMITSGDHVIILVDVDEVHYRPSEMTALGFHRGRFLSPGA